MAIHLRDLRPNIDGPGSVRGLAGALARLDAAGHDLRGEIHLFTHTRDPAGAREVRTVVTQSPHLDLIEAARRSDAALVAELSGLSASVMPYRHGTHSGWAELCWDLGVPVLGADLGHIADQHDDPGWFTPVDVSDPAALASALAALPPVDPNARARTRTHRAKGRAAVAETIAVAHREVYERALRAV